MIFNSTSYPAAGIAGEDADLDVAAIGGEGLWGDVSFSIIFGTAAALHRVSGVTLVKMAEIRFYHSEWR